ncbi:MAG: hypothetical protein PHE17_18085 [Thiothrix sp.]|uniref:hypothetical protein n=1 Tax=Thiothrix sp. TaxID=1032 RepID=UPI00262E4758|nr:hypothetical protein [Thiothrix sp.]MDD5394931.1 hypothetical protein [Thiothrix sp.]
MEEKTRTFGQFATVPDQYQDAINYGISFFECRLRFKHKWGQTLRGPFDVRVTDMDKDSPMASVEGPRYKVEWITDSNRPGIRFEPVSPKSSLSVAFIVDDDGWYNRVLIADPLNSVYEVVAYHSATGVLPASSIRPWFDCIRDRLWKEFPLYRVIRSDGREVGTSYRNHDAAVEFMNSTDEDTGKKLYPRATIFTDNVWDKTEECERIIRENRNIQHGWTSSTEFRFKIRPEIEKAIAESMMETGSSDIAVPRTMDEIKNMSPEMKAALREAQLGPTVPPASAARQENQVQTEPADTRKLVDMRSPHRGDYLNKQILIARANELGIESPEALPNREALIEAIVVAQNGETKIPVGPAPKKPETAEVVT